MKRRGFVMADILLGLAIVGLLAIGLTVVLNRQERASQILADSRDATRLAERAVTALQSGRPLPPDDAQQQTGVRRLPDPAPTGQAWVEVSARVRGREVSLVALIPASSAPAGGER